MLEWISHEDHRLWNLKDGIPITDVGDVHRITEVIATGPEQKIIHKIFGSTVPEVYRVPYGHPTRWFGDHAKFIMANLASLPWQTLSDAAMGR